MEAVLTPFALASVAAATGGFGGLAILFTLLVARGRRLSFLDKLVLIWCMYDAVTHFLLVSTKNHTI